MKEFEGIELLKNMLNIKQVVNCTNLTHSQIYGLRRAGKFPAGLKIGSARLWTAESVNNWLNTRKENCEYAQN